MKKWFPLVMVGVCASIGTPLRADIFDRLVQVEQLIPLGNGGSEAVDPGPVISQPAPTIDRGYADPGSKTLVEGYPFKTNCCQSRNDCITDIWKGYCGRGHGDCNRMNARFTNRSHRQKCDGGCGKTDCSIGKCGHVGIAYGKGFDQVPWGHVQHGKNQLGKVQHRQKGFSGCRTCGRTPCACRARHPGCRTCGRTPCACRARHQQKSVFGDFGKSWGWQGFSKGGASKGWFNASPPHAPATNMNSRVGLFDWLHSCGTCGKSKGFGFGKGDCGCGSGRKIVNGWNQKGDVIWGDSQSMDVPYGQPTPSNDPPIELELNVPVDSLPVPSTPTGHSAGIPGLLPVGEYQYLVRTGQLPGI